MFPQIYKKLPEGHTISYSWFSAMHSRLDTLLCDLTEKEAGHITELLQNETARLENIVNRFSPASELYGLNRAAAGTNIPISPELTDILEECRYWNKKTLGFFDISIQSPFRGKSYIGEFELDKKRLICRKHDPGLILDLSGYAKGYALDQLRLLLLREGVSNALFNFGNSSVCALGSHPYGKGWMVGMESLTHPGTNIHETTLFDQCLTTSGNNKEDRLHIINPENGKLRQGQKQISIVTETGTSGEALSTALFAVSETKKEALFAIPECLHYYEY